jgi:hypothetical protein
MLWEGAVVGEGEALTGEAYRYSVITETHCRLLFINRFPWCMNLPPNIAAAVRHVTTSESHDGQLSNCARCLHLCLTLAHAPCALRLQIRKLAPELNCGDATVMGRAYRKLRTFRGGKIRGPGAFRELMTREIATQRSLTVASMSPRAIAHQPRLDPLVARPRTRN